MGSPWTHTKCVQQVTYQWIYLGYGKLFQVSIDQEKVWISWALSLLFPFSIIHQSPWTQETSLGKVNLPPMCSSKCFWWNSNCQGTKDSINLDRRPVHRGVTERPSAWAFKCLNYFCNHAWGFSVTSMPHSWGKKHQFKIKSQDQCWNDHKYIFTWEQTLCLPNLLRAYNHTDFYCVASMLQCKYPNLRAQVITVN